MKERGLGLLLLVVGAAITYWCVYEPLEAAKRQEPKVSIYMKGAFLCPFCIGMGCTYLVLGGTATKIFGTREQPNKVPAYACAGVLLVAGIILYYWLKTTLEQHGYNFN